MDAGYVKERIAIEQINMKFATIIFFALAVCLLITDCEDLNQDEETPSLGGGPEPPILPHYFDHPAWHPDGEWIATEHSDSIDTDEDGKRDQKFSGIWLVNGESGETQPLISGFGMPAWSRDGKKLAMVGGAQIFTVEVASLEPAAVDNNSLVQLTTEGNNFYPAWSPDGQWIAYDSNLDDPIGANVIWKIKADGSFREDISDHGVGEWRMPNWAPFDNSIVHQRYVGVNAPEIVVMDTTGQNPIRLTINYQGDYHPKYSPDGTSIAWLAHREMSFRHWEMDIWIMNSDGSEHWKLTTGNASRFDWSPDGNRIVFLHWNSIEDIPGNGELWLINADSVDFDLRQLTHFKE